MRTDTLLLVSFSSLVFTSPTPFPQGAGQGADSCPSDPLSTDTWNKLKIHDFLVEAAKNYTRTKTNNVQSLADSFGAPNFFCGLDKFCNAGQPCLPIKLPAWYAAIAIQNWNNYMNSLNTAISFASSIISLKLGEIVADVMPDPVDNITPLKNIGTIFGAVLGIVPFTGPVAKGAGLLTSGLSFVLGRVKPPAPADKFLAWTNVASSMADVVRDYQTIISNSVESILDAEIDDANNGIASILKGGAFLGVSQNFTQTDLQDVVIEGITQTAIGMALQAQKIFVARFSNRVKCNPDDVPNELCLQDQGASTFTLWILLKNDSKGVSQPVPDIAKTLLDKYGMTKEQLLKGPTDCFDGNGKKQLANPVEAFGALPSDPKAPCVMNMLVCEIDVVKGTGNKGVADFCKEDFGLDI